MDIIKAFAIGAGSLHSANEPRLGQEGDIVATGI
jgi:hypothetical protein